MGQRVNNLVWDTDVEDWVPLKNTIVPTADGSNAVAAVVKDGAILAADWTGAGLGSAPDPELYSPRQIGADLGAIATGLTYHVIGDVGSKAWVATGATVKNLYGGA